MARRRSKPTDPETIALEAARRRALEREKARDPANWGLSDQVVVALPTAADVVVRQSGAHVHARRHDIFRHLLNSGAIDQAQHRASERYFEDRVAALGVRTREGQPLQLISGGGNADGVSQGMIDAGRRVARIEAKIGRRALAVIRAIMDKVVAGDVGVWRAWVERVSGEAERHAQAAVVRSALEDMIAGYAEMDREDADRRRRGARGDDFPPAA